MKLNLLSKVGLFRFIIMSLHAPSIDEIFNLNREALDVISEPFYVYTTTNFFQSTNNDETNQDIIKTAIENTKRYLSVTKMSKSNFEHPTSDIEKKDPKDFLYHLYQNILDRCKLCELIDEDDDDVTFYVSYVFNAICITSENILRGYINFVENEKKNRSFIQKLIDFFLSILIFFKIIKDTRPNNSIYFIKEHLSGMENLKKDEDDLYEDKIKYGILYIGYTLIILEIKQTILPVNYRIYNQLKKEMSILLSIVKLIGHTTGISIRDQYFPMASDIKKYLGEINLKLSQYKKDELHEFRTFIKKNKEMLENANLSWAAEKSGRWTETDINSLFKEYIESLQEASSNEPKRRIVEDKSTERH